MQLDEFNRLEDAEARMALQKCCGSETWVQLMMQHFPFASVEALHRLATDIWREACEERDWLEAFAHHPKIGDTTSLRQKFAATSEWAGAEQAGMQTAGSDLIEELAKGNREYENKFGFIFIVCAT
jgi:2-oxo-4-hydroxy-4-carboxy-5-ureidoimidazoline decarboxylase